MIMTVEEARAIASEVASATPGQHAPHTIGTMCIAALVLANNHYDRLDAHEREARWMNDEPADGPS